MVNKVYAPQQTPNIIGICKHYVLHLQKLQSIMNNIIKWLIILMTALNFGYMSFDGSRGLILGDYLRPETGEYAGQLGPWTALVQAVGIAPESNTMKTIFLVWGVVGLVLSVSFAMEVRKSSTYLLILCVLSVWYLVPGTILSALSAILLLVLRRRTPQP